MKEDKKQTLYKIIKEKGCFKNQCAFCPMDVDYCGRGIYENISDEKGNKAVYENALKLKKHMGV